MLLLRFDDNGVRKSHAIAPGKTVIGRLSSSDLVLSDLSVSRLHATVRMADGHCFLRDAGSRHGTFRNGERVSDEVELRSGDTVQVGEVVLACELEVAENEILSEDHYVDEGPQTVFRPVVAPAPVAGPGQNPVIALLTETVKTLVTSHSLPDTLNRVVDLAFIAVFADRAFLMLRESADEALVARVMRKRDGSIPEHATLSRHVVRRAMRERVAILATDTATDPNLSSSDSIASLQIRSFMCAPLTRQDEVIGVLYVDSPQTARFAMSDLDVFSALANAAAVAIEQARLSSELQEELRLRERLQRYHSPAVVSRILQGGAGDTGMTAHEREVTVMFCDMVGFTTLCENLPAADTAVLLNGFLTSMTDVIFAHDGTLDKFLGDALLAVFGAPFGDPNHASKAVKAALAMRQALAEFNEQRDGPPVAMRIAISTGTALTGDIGSPRRREFTVLGDVVNTASRLEDEVAGPGEIVIADATYQRVKDQVRVRPLGAKKLRGRAAPLDVFSVEAWTASD
jgi:adenylate cyclase